MADRTLLRLDSRRRVTLGKLATADLYLVNVEEDGTIVLVPVVVMPLIGASDE